MTTDPAIAERTESRMDPMRPDESVARLAERQGKSVAIVICTHHKPALVMGTLLSVLAQQEVAADLHVVFNSGDGYCADRPGYSEYHALCGHEDHRGMLDSWIDEDAEYVARAKRKSVNHKLSPFDERLRDICLLNGRSVRFHEFENDQALDSGVWLKIIRSGVWRDYDYVFFLQEGTLLTSRHSISAAVDFAERHDVHFLGGGHMKGCVAREAYCRSALIQEPTIEINQFHNRMIQRTFEIFCRDPDLEAALNEWPSERPSCRQFHVHDFNRRTLFHILAGVDPDRPLWGSKTIRRIIKLLRLLRWQRVDLEYGVARIAVLLRSGFGINLKMERSPDGEHIWVDYDRHPVSEVTDVIPEKDLFFHLEPGVEWFGCGCNHMFSRKLLEDFSRRFEEFDLYDVLDFPFAGSGLEVFWAFVPRWLGYRKWFYDGMHRITKDPATKRRIDDPEGMATNLNRYFLGDIAVGVSGDLLSVRAVSPDLSGLKEELPPAFFH